MLFWTSLKKKAVTATWYWLRTITSSLATKVGFLIGLPFTVCSGEDLVFRRHIINADTDYSAAAVIDVDHDGRLDIVCGGDWYQAPTWQKHFVANIPRINGRPDGFSHLEFDVNRDGWTDVITVNYRSRSLKWMEHPGAGQGPWIVHTAVEPGPMETGRLVDIDGDGRLDLLPNGANFAAWWEFRWNSNLPKSEPAWIRHDLPPEAGGHGLGFGDIDGDGRGDIVGQHGWLSAPQDARNGEWTWHPDFELERGSIPMLVVDPDEDGDNDIVWCSAHGFGVYWLEQRIDDNANRVWQRHAIDTSWSQGHSPLWADLDGNGRMELITGKRYMAHGGADPGEYDPIESYRYEFDPKTRTWRRWLLSPVGDRVGMGLDPKIVDLDGDGDLDLVTSGRSGLYWLENLGQGNSSALEPPLPAYAATEGLLQLKIGRQEKHIDEPESWGMRRWQIVRNLQQNSGAEFDSHDRSPLNLQVTESELWQGIEIQSIDLQVDLTQQLTARLYRPTNADKGTRFGLIGCQDNSLPSSNSSSATSASVDGFDELAKYAAHGGHTVLILDLNVKNSDKTLIKDLVWKITRGIDVLQALPEVQAEHLGLFADEACAVAGLLAVAMDQRLITNYIAIPQPTDTRSQLVDLGCSWSELLSTVAPRKLNVWQADALLSVEDSNDIFRPVREIYGLRKATDAFHIVEQRTASLKAWIDSP